MYHTGPASHPFLDDAQLGRYFYILCMQTYNKAFLDYEELAERAMSRGLGVSSKDILVSVLKRISYYRFTGYLFPFKQQGSEDYLPGTTLAGVLDRYYFDDELRKITFAALAEVELQLRNDILHEHTRRYGPFGFLTNKSLPFMNPLEHSTFISSMQKNNTTSKELFIVRYNVKYSCSNALPFWMALETSTFGELLYVHKGLEGDIKNVIANKYHLPKQVIRSWLLSLNYIRNICAHHYRLWDKNLSVTPRRREKRSEWTKPVPVDTSKFYAVALVVLHFQKHIDTIGWKKAFLSIVKKYPGVPLCGRMGFPEDWQQIPIWRAK